MFVASRRRVHTASANDDGLEPTSDTSALSSAASSSPNSNAVSPSTVTPPRRPPSAWQAFAIEHSGEKHISIKSLVKAGPIWSGLSAAEKKPYLDAAAAARKEYIRLRDEYCKVYGLIPPRLPRQPGVRMAAARGLGLTATLIHAAWRRLSEEEKQPYIDSYDADMKKYRLSKIEFATQLQPGALSDVFEQKRVVSHRVVKRVTDLVHHIKAHPTLTKAPRPPPPAFKIYRPGTGLTVAEAAEKFREMTEEEQKPYHEAYKLALSKYQEQKRMYKRIVAGKVVRMLDGTELQNQTKTKGLARRSIPTHPFFRFYSEFLKTWSYRGDGQRPTRVAAARWYAMSDEDKAPYVDAYAREMEAYKLRQREPSSLTHEE